MSRRLRRSEGGPSPVREAMTRYVAIGLVTIALISLVGVWLFRRAGEAEAIRDAKDQTRIAAEGRGARPQRRAPPRASRARSPRSTAWSRSGCCATRRRDRAREDLGRDRPDRLLGRAAPDRRCATRSTAHERARLQDRTRRRRGERPLEAGEPVRAGHRQAARGLPADPHAERAAAAVRDVLPLELHLGPRRPDLPARSRRR